MAIDTTLLNQRMNGFGVTTQQLGTLMGRTSSTVQSWVSGTRRVPREALDHIAAAVDLPPERLVMKSKLFEPSKFDHYLRQRRVSVDKLLTGGRFEQYSCSTINKWRRGHYTPSEEAVRILERGLGLNSGALTDGPLENVPAFTSVEVERWSQPGEAAKFEGLAPKAASIKDVLRSCRKDRGMSWDEFSRTIPGYSPSTVFAWLRGSQEPSRRAICVLQEVLNLAPGSLVKRYFTPSVLSDPLPEHLMNMPVEYGATTPAAALQGGRRPEVSQPHDLLASASAIATPVPQENLGDLIPLVFEVIAHDASTPQKWSESFDYLIPHILVELPAWPRGRGLQIDSSEGEQLRTGNNADPAPVRVYNHQGAYYGVEYGQPVPVTPDGDNFFRALLVSMGQAVSTLANGLSLGADRSERAAIAALRSHLAQHVMTHQEQVAPLLRAWSLQTPSSSQAGLPELS